MEGILLIKTELGESDQHVQMGPHTPDHQDAEMDCMPRGGGMEKCYMQNAFIHTGFPMSGQNTSENVYTCVGNHKAREETMTL